MCTPKPCVVERAEGSKVAVRGAAMAAGQVPATPGIGGSASLPVVVSTGIFKAWFSRSAIKQVTYKTKHQKVE